MCACVYLCVCVCPCFVTDCAVNPGNGLDHSEEGGYVCNQQESVSRGPPPHSAHASQGRFGSFNQRRQATSNLISEAYALKPLICVCVCVSVHACV